MRNKLQTRIFSTIMHSDKPLTAQQIKKALTNASIEDIQAGLVQLYARQVVDKENYQAATPTKWFITRQEDDPISGVPF